ncbi:Cupredoxin [Parasponia andersonii]|uniref:Cupredoxin n=1 Tax=Parasponia andersonii TaxID=3476 RepID=A0A2P5BLM9_PARAD|nr:Cupredoxin [Parasponia andersonii]
MGSQRYFGFLVIFFIEFLSVTQAYKFFVGRKDGWVLNPSENFNHWAERNRFQVNDTLFFKYKEGSDSVLVVNRDDYDTCNATNPKLSLTDGSSVFTFDRSGPFYFISGKNCQKGQKLVVVVLAVRDKKRQPTSPPPAAPPPASVATLPPITAPTSSPAAQSPGVESPESRVDPSELDGPAPAPNDNSGNWAGFGGSFGSVLCAGLGVSMVLGM